LVPRGLAEAADGLGYVISVDSFPAAGFAALFTDAVARHAAPDILTFDNYGVIEGITTALGTFAGIAQDPTVQRDLIKVTGAFDELLGVQRGWTYLFAASPNHGPAKTLALGMPTCPHRYEGSIDDDLASLAPRLATSYLEEDTIALQPFADLERLVTSRTKSKRMPVVAARLCGTWGNARLAFAHVAATYRADAAMGQAVVLLGFRKQASRWELLVAARDPRSTGAFLRDAATMSALLSPDERVQTLPVPAVLLAPSDGDFPRPLNGARFGSFVWQPSPSSEVVAEIAEFAYEDDARLIFRPPAPHRVGDEVSTGSLWTTGGPWRWRVWSMTRQGDVAFSDVRTFRH
jgi:hypothetical protein